MGLLKTTHHHHSIDNSIRFPENIKIQEHKAPTDESIKLLEEMHDKAMKNIIAKVKVDNNLVNGEVFCIEQPWNIDEFKLVFKFKINDQEFNFDQSVNRDEFWKDKDLSSLQLQLADRAKSIMLWYALKKFTTIMYEKITQNKFPEGLLK